MFGQCSYIIHAYHHTKGKHRALNREVMCNFRLYLEIGRTSVKQKVLNIYLCINVETTVVYTQENPITLPIIGTGQMSRLNAHCSPLVILYSVTTQIIYTHEFKYNRHTSNYRIKFQYTGKAWKKRSQENQKQLIQ